MTACFDVSLDVCQRHRRRLRLQQNPRAILFGAMLGGAEHRLHLFVVDLVVDDEALTFSPSATNPSATLPGPMCARVRARVRQGAKNMPMKRPEGLRMWAEAKFLYS